MENNAIQSPSSDTSSASPISSTKEEILRVQNQIRSMLMKAEDEGVNEDQHKVEAEISVEQTGDPIVDDSQDFLKQMNVKELDEKDINDLVQEDVLEDNFMDNHDYNTICETLMNGDLEEHNNLQPHKKVEFLVRLYQDPLPQSETILATILPFTGTTLIHSSFRFFSPENIKSNKQVSLFKRLCYEKTPNADECLISLLLGSNEETVSQLDIQTLSLLRQKEHLGDSYFNQLMQEKGGALSKKDFKKVARLSAKISTICYAYYLETAKGLLSSSRQENTPVTKERLSDIKGLATSERNRLHKALKEQGLIQEDLKPDRDTVKADFMNKVDSIIQESISMNKAFIESIKSTGRL